MKKLMYSDFEKQCYPLEWIDKRRKWLWLLVLLLLCSPAYAHEWKNPMICVSSKSTFEEKIYMVCEEIEDEHKCYSDKVGCSQPIQIDDKILCEVKCKELPND